MNFEQFILVMMEQVKSRLSEDTLVERQEILKNNGVRLVGISIRREGEMAAPIIYMEAYYSMYCEGVPVEVLAEHMLMILQMTPAIPDYDFEEFFDFHKIKHRIVYKLINAKKNAKLLKKVPNLPMLDFAVVFYVLVSIDENESCSILIRNEHMNEWKLPISILYQYAKDNTQRLCPYVIKPLEELFEEDAFDEVPDSSLIVLTNRKNVNGASVILYPNMPKVIFDYVGKNYYLLPSSIHEFLIVPDHEHINPLKLKGIVRDINEKLVDREEFLSDNIYYFNGEIITEM